MGQASSDMPASSEKATDAPPTAWEFGDIGYDTEKKSWFVQLFNEANQNVGTYLGKKIVLKRGRATQYQWKDSQGRPFWHVRERFFADEIDSIGIDPKGVLLTVVYKERKDGKDRDEDSPVPGEYSYLLYAFHVMNRDSAKTNRAPLGFIEFYSSAGELVGKLNNRWVILEDVERKSVGEYPKIRLRIEKKDVHHIVVTRSAVAIQGKPKA